MITKARKHKSTKGLYTKKDEANFVLSIFRVFVMKIIFINQHYSLIFNVIYRFGILNFGHWDLPFDVAQGGEPVEPFGIWVL
jgi:hypothetical protein